MQRAHRDAVLGTMSTASRCLPHPAGMPQEARAGASNARRCEPPGHAINGIGSSSRHSSRKH